MCKKRCKARVTIGGQCVLLQNYLKILLFDFFIKPKLPYESHLSRHTSEPRKEILKIIETRPQSSKNAQKWIKICKIYDVGKSTLVFGFQQLFSVQSLTLAQKTEKKLRKNCFENVVLVWFSIVFLCFIFELSTENIKKKIGQNCFENLVSEYEKRC